MHLEEIKDLLIQAGYGPSWTPKSQNKLDRIHELEDILHECAKILKVKPLEVGNEVVRLLVEQNAALKRIIINGKL